MHTEPPAPRCPEAWGERKNILLPQPTDMFALAPLHCYWQSSALSATMKPLSPRLQTLQHLCCLLLSYPDQWNLWHIFFTIRSLPNIYLCLCACQLVFAQNMLEFCCFYVVAGLVLLDEIIPETVLASTFCYSSLCICSSRPLQSAAGSLFLLLLGTVTLIDKMII